MQRNVKPCHCKTFSCSLNPNGFRLLPVAVKLKHQRADEATTEEALVNAKSHNLLSTIQEQLQTYLESDLLTATPTFRSNLSTAQEHRLISPLLKEDEPVNSPLLSFETWHNTAMETLCSIPRSTETNGLPLLVKRVSAFHSRVLLKTLAALEKQEKSEAVEQANHEAPSSDHLELEISLGLRNYGYPSPLVFCIKDNTPSSEPRTCSNDATQPGDRLMHQLDLDATENRSTLAQLAWIEVIIAELQTGSHPSLSRMRLEELVAGMEEHRYNVMAHVKSEELSKRCPTASICTIKQTMYHSILMFTPHVVMTALMLMSLKFIYHLPRRALSEFLRGFLRVLPSQCDSSHLPPRGQEAALDPRTYYKIIDSTIEEDLSAICPKCATCYPLDKDGVPSTPKCIFRATPRSKLCNEPLCRNRRGTISPIMVFRRRKLDDWMRSFLGRKGIIEAVDEVWKHAQGPVHEPMSDFWGGSFIRDMKGPDGNGAFSDVPDGESRLLFSLAIDWFNPFHNKIAGKSVSTGVIFMSCLNLPPEERYLPENIYLVGILPGRKQISKMNGILQPLVADLLRYWSDGVYFTGIPGVDAARLIRCALVQLVCDLPAARKVSGFPGHTSIYNCSVCYAKSKDVANLGSPEDPTLKRTLEEHMEHATAYKVTMESEGYTAAENLRRNSRQYGVRWSTLNLLPYWDPIRCTVIDSMHLILLRLSQFHWREFWNADEAGQSQDSRKGLEEITVVHALDQMPGLELNQAHHDDAQDNDEVGWEDEDTTHLQGGHHATSGSSVKTQAVKQVLDFAAMQKARRCWLYSDLKALGNLNIAQLLCLLQENDGTLPDSFKQKKDLLTVLKASREKFGLPKSRPTVSLKKLAKSSRTPIPAESVRTGPVFPPSTSEILLNDKSPIQVPQLLPDKGNAPEVVPSFITTEELVSIQADIAKTVLPSWVTKVGRHFGEKANGKLKAAEWRSLMSIYLPISLLRLWSNSSRHTLHLKALLSLSIIVNIVTSRRISKTTIDFYDSTIQYYLHLISTLGSGDFMVITHHLALHLSKFMRSHGPCRSHWAFPFERLIGTLQKLPHNYLISDIPGTMTKAFTTQATLKALTRNGIRSACIPRWRGITQKRQARTTRIAMDPKILTQLNAIYCGVAAWASSLYQVKIGGATYRPCREASDFTLGDANIGFLTISHPKRYITGRIHKIIKFRVQNGREEVLAFLVHRHKPTPTGFDAQCWEHLLGHRALGLQTTGEGVEAEIEVVPFDFVIGHVAINKLESPFGPVLLTLQLTDDFEARRRIPFSNI